MIELLTTAEPTNRKPLEDRSIRFQQENLTGQEDFDALPLLQLYCVI